MVISMGAQGWLCTHLWLDQTQTVENTQIRVKHPTHTHKGISLYANMGMDAATLRTDNKLQLASPQHSEHSRRRGESSG